MFLFLILLSLTKLVQQEALYLSKNTGLGKEIKLLLQTQNVEVVDSTVGAIPADAVEKSPEDFKKLFEPLFW